MKNGLLVTACMLFVFGQQLSTDEANLKAIAVSGRCATVAETADERVQTRPIIAPGEPPLLSFRYYEGQSHHRYGNSDLMLDDAGH